MRVGYPEPHFVGYEGRVEGPRELYDAIVAETRCETAILDGVLVDDWKDESDLEVDDQGNAYTRQFGGRQIFAAFDLLEIDGESLLTIPLLERRRASVASCSRIGTARTRPEKRPMIGSSSKS